MSWDEVVVFSESSCWCWLNALIKIELKGLPLWTLLKKVLFFSDRTWSKDTSVTDWSFNFCCDASIDVGILSNSILDGLISLSIVMLWERLYSIKVLDWIDWVLTWQFLWCERNFSLLVILFLAFLHWVHIVHCLEHLSHCKFIAQEKIIVLSIFLPTILQLGHSVSFLGHTP